MPRSDSVLYLALCTVLCIKVMFCRTCLAFQFIRRFSFCQAEQLSLFCAAGSNLPCLMRFLRLLLFACCRSIAFCKDVCIFCTSWLWLLPTYRWKMRKLSPTAVTQITMLMLSCGAEKKLCKIAFVALAQCTTVMSTVVAKKHTPAWRRPQSTIWTKCTHSTHASLLQLFANQLTAFNSSSAIATLGCMHPATAHLLLGRVHFLHKRSRTSLLPWS